MHSLRIASFGLAFALATAAGATTATTPVVGDATSLLFTIDLEELDVEISPIGLAEEDGTGRFVLPISGGEAGMMPLRGFIEHEDSGLDIDIDGLPSFEIHDLVIDFNDNIVSGDIESGPFSGNVDLFDLQPCVDGGCTGPGGTVPITGFGLFLREDAADLFENVIFGSDHFDDGDQIALANVDLVFDGGTPVTEPATLMLLGVGLAGLGALRRRAS